MSRAKLVLAGAVSASLLSACGIVQKPVVGESHVDHLPGNHSVYDDPRTVHKACLRDLGLGIRDFTTAGSFPGIQVGKSGTDPKIVFYPVSPILLKMSGKTPGGILIGSAVVYPNRATGKIAKEVVDCVDQGVPG